MSELQGSGDVTQSLPLRIAEYCEKLSDSEKSDIVTRRSTLKEINTLLKCESNLLQECELDKLVHLLINNLSYDSEKCREIAATTLIVIFKTGIIDSALPHLFKTLSTRLRRTDEREQSEEVRLLEVDLMHNVIEKYEGDFLNYLNDISSCISSCITDDYPEIKKNSCVCLTILSTKPNSRFHMVGCTFLKPLLATISHQHFKTRALCVEALVTIFDFLNHEEFKEAISSLAQRLFDHAPLVRKAVTKGVGKMLISLKDRYSYFKYLIPLALSSLHDDVEEIRMLAQEVWSAAGNQYLEENDSDYKDIVTSSRSALGCQVLVQRNVFNILPALLNDLTDWSPEARIKSAKVLYSIILHSKEKITINLLSVLEEIIIAAKDEEKSVGDEALKCAELLGEFIDSNLLMDNILKLTHENPTATHLSVLAASLRGCKSSLPTECFEALGKFLADPSVSRLRQSSEQANLLLCVEGLLDKGNEISNDASYNMFTVLSSVSGLTSHDSIFKKANALLKNLAELQSYSLKDLFGQHAVPLLQVLCENNELWTSQSSEVYVFHFIVLSECFHREILTIIVPALINSLHPSKDAKIRSKVLSLLIPLFEKLSPSEYGLFSKEINELILKGIFPNLSWSAGKTVSSLRTVAAASLYEILSKSSLKKEMMHSFGNELLPILETLLDEDAAPTRLLACKILELILPYMKDNVDELKIHKACHDILRCMDDESDEIRLMTLRVLKAYLKSFPGDYNWTAYKAYLKNMFENVIVHMDDKNEKIKTSVSDFLKEIGSVSPEILIQEIEKKKFMMSSNSLCDDIVEHIKHIEV